MIKLDSTATLSKRLSATAKKDAKGVPTVISSLKFSDLQIDRDTVDELLSMPVGWSRGVFYDEQGTPLRRFFVGVKDRQWRVSGGLSGPKPGETLALLQADLEHVELTLIPNGALMDGTLTWAARGDEIEDVSSILDTEVRAVWELTDAAQGDMFDAQSTGAMKATAETQSILAQLGKGTPPQQDLGHAP